MTVKDRLKKVVAMILGVAFIDDLSHRLGLNFINELSNAEFLAGILGGALAISLGDYVNKLAKYVVRLLRKRPL